ncbi:hypothetical protein V6N13_058311 [Hibiscus sabdariffa]|uniref:Uncharacterized protein n=1 Tax=Hibiscus sabdariffa TaxID=183260 RepID=A0ABR2GH66_9ROSI
MVEPVELLHQKPVMKKKEKAQHPKNPVGLDKNIGTSSIIPTTMHSMQKKKAIHLPNESGSSAKKIETTARSPTMKQFMEKEKIQPSKGSAGVASKSGTRTLPSRLVTQRKETTFDNQRQKHHICKDHIVWEGSFAGSPSHNRQLFLSGTMQSSKPGIGNCWSTRLCG